MGRESTCSFLLQASIRPLFHILPLCLENGRISVTFLSLIASLQLTGSEILSSLGIPNPSLQARQASRGERGGCG